MNTANAYFITGTAYAGKSTMVKLLAERHSGIACRENYHEELMDDKLNPGEFPCLCYTRDLQDWHDFIRRTPDEYVYRNSSFCAIIQSFLPLSGKSRFLFFWY